MNVFLKRVFVILSFAFGCGDLTAEVQVEKIPGSKPRNIILILADDHRYDAMGFMGHPFLGLMRRVREVNSDHETTGDSSIVSKLVPGFRYFPSTAALLKPVMREQDRAILCEKDPEYFHRLASYVGRDHRRARRAARAIREPAERAHAAVSQSHHQSLASTQGEQHAQIGAQTHFQRRGVRGRRHASRVRRGGVWRQR